MAVRTDPWQRVEGLNPLLMDAALVAAIAVPAVVLTVGAEGPRALLMTAAMIVPLLWRRRWPVAVYSVQVVALLVAGVVAPPVAQFVLCFLGVLVGAYSTGRHGPRWRRSLGVVVPSMVPMAAIAVMHGSTLNMFWFLQILFAWLIGFWVRRQLGRVPPAPAPLPAVPSAGGFASLTPREVEVLRLLARGHSNRELAEQLHIGEGTVKTHVARILGKLGVRDRVQAVVLAYETGLVEPGESIFRQTR